MDKKNTLIGVCLLVTALALTFTMNKRTEPTEETMPVDTAQTSATQDASSTPADSSAPVAAPAAAVPVASGHAQLEANEAHDGEVIVSLENSLIEARFTNLGAALKEVRLKGIKKTLDSDEDYVMNALRFAPALNLTTYLGDGKNIAYRVLVQDSDSVSFVGKLSDSIEVIRRYSIAQQEEGPEPYTIKTEISYRNLSDQPIPFGESYLDLGTVAPSGNQDRLLQTYGYYDGEDVEFIDQADFMGGGLPFMKKAPKDIETGSANIVWASLKNQFFITILTPGQPGTGFVAQPVDFPATNPEEQLKTGMTGQIKIPAFNLPVADTITQSFDFYVGPKEHGRISKLRQNQEQAMQFGFFGMISKFLLMIMNALYGLVGNWGVAIILLTIVVRGSLLPITLMSMRSMRKMSKLQEPMKAMKEKFADQPQKQQQMMMELYKLNKVNPVAGCLPMVLQIPIFFALFYMLRSAAELRFADFLWISDLSHPDTVATLHNVPFLGTLPLNILPFFWIVTLAYQMWTMPSPTVDNAQAKMMKFMPFIFFPFTYTFSSGLVLYWSVSNLFTIGQQWLAKRNDPNFEVVLPPALKKALEGDTKKKRRK